MSSAPQADGRFLTGSTFGHVVRMSLTGAAGISFVFLVDAANLFWLSQLGEPQLVAAVGFAFAIQYFSVSSGVGLMIAATALVSRAIGEGRRDEARRRAGAAIVIAVAVQALMATLLVGFRHQIIAMAGAEGETAALAARYLAITVPSLVIMAVGLMASGALRAEGLGARAMMVTLTSGSVSMVIDPMFIYGFGWGLDGAATGLVISRCVLTGMALLLAVRMHGLIARPDLPNVRRLFLPFMMVALPVIAAQMAMPAGNYIVTILMAPFGDQAVAAWAVVGRLTTLAFGGIFALSGAIGGIFGQNMGAGQFDRLRHTYRDALIFCAVYAGAMWALMLLTLPLVIAGFGLDPEGAAVVRAFAQVGSGAFVFVGFLFVASAAFNSLGRPLRSTLLVWLREAALTWPFALWLAAMFGAPGVIYGQALAGLVGGCIAIVAGWLFVRGLGPGVAVDAGPVRAYPNAERYRRR